MLFGVKFVCLAVRFIAVRIVPGRWILASELFVASLLIFQHCVYLTMRGKIFRVSLWFRPARKPLQPAYGRMAKSARRCSLRPSRRSAKRAMEQCAQNSRGNIAFCPRTLRKTVLFFPFCFLFPYVPTVALANVFSMFPVFLA